MYQGGEGAGSQKNESLILHVSHLKSELQPSTQKKQLWSLGEIELLSVQREIN